MNYWLMKSEPDELSIDALKKIKRAPWIGVRGYQARNFMRDEMRVGDQVMFYHSSVAPAGPAGVARVASLPYPDFTQFNKRSKYFDSKSTKATPIWVMVDVRFVKKFPRIITREEMKKVKALQHMQLWKYLRLSITPLTKEEFMTITKMASREL